jgi:E3 ubiquitin-protein ligase SIAH1
MDEPQIKLMFAMPRFHCLACYCPVKPPTFKVTLFFLTSVKMISKISRFFLPLWSDGIKDSIILIAFCVSCIWWRQCEAGHVICATCRTAHTQACDRAATDAACSFSEFGCTSLPVYHQFVEHKRSCTWAPCYCPAPGCDTHTSPARLLDHFRAGHDWPVTYGKPCDLGGMHALVGKDDRRVFLASASPLGPSTAIAVSLVCLRTRGDVAPGVPQFRCRLWSFLWLEGSQDLTWLLPNRIVAGDFSQMTL